MSSASRRSTAPAPRRRTSPNRASMPASMAAWAPSAASRPECSRRSPRPRPDGPSSSGDRGAVVEVEARALGVYHLPPSGPRCPVISSARQAQFEWFARAVWRLAASTICAARADLQHARRHLDRQQRRSPACFLTSMTSPEPPRPFDQAVVARLTAALGIEGRGVEQHFHDVAGQPHQRAGRPS